MEERDPKNCANLLPEIECDWTEELFTVVKCIETRSPVYLVKDDHGEILEGTLYVEEIQKVIKQDDVYKIQSVLKKRRKYSI